MFVRSVTGFSCGKQSHRRTKALHAKVVGDLILGGGPIEASFPLKKIMFGP